MYLVLMRGGREFLHVGGLLCPYGEPFSVGAHGHDLIIYDLSCITDLDLFK